MRSAWSREHCLALEERSCPVWAVLPPTRRTSAERRRQRRSFGVAAGAGKPTAPGATACAALGADLTIRVLPAAPVTGDAVLPKSAGHPAAVGSMSSPAVIEPVFAGCGVRVYEGPGQEPAGARLNLHQGWHREQDWMNLFETTCGPLAQAA